MKRNGAIVGAMVAAAGIVGVAALAGSRKRLGSPFEAIGWGDLYGAEGDISESPNQGYDPGIVSSDWISPGSGTPPQALISGPANDPEIAALLAEIDGLLAQAGINLRQICARELCELPKAPGRPCSIPPRSLWRNIVPTAVLVQTMRTRLGFPLELRGYRPPDYNAAVGGSKRSQHQWFGAIDVYAWPSVRNASTRVAVAEAGARVFVENPAEAIGFGVYGKATPSNIHLDTGFRRRTWRDAQIWIDRIRDA